MQAVTMQAGTTTRNIHALVLLILLAVSAGVRFYALDQNGLSAQEIFNVNFCGQEGVWTTAVHYADHTGLPAVYPTALCAVVDGPSTPDFLIRAVSAALGVVLIFVVYCLGRDFLSATTGLIAAAWVALDFNGILIDRSVTPYTLFALLYLIHFYLFCHLLLGKAQQSTSWKVDIRRPWFQCVFYWSPSSPCHAGVLLLFWCVSVLVFYTNTVALWGFFVEMAAVLVLLPAEKRKAFFMWLWIPVITATAFWWMRWYSMLDWVMHGNFFGLPTDLSQWLSRFSVLSSVGERWLWIELGLFGAAALVVGVLCIRRHYNRASTMFLVLLIMHLLAACMVLLGVKAVDPRSYLYGAVAMALITAELLAWPLKKVRPVVLHDGALLLCIVIIVGYQLNDVIRYKLYNREGEKGFLLAARSIAADTGFLNGHRDILMSTPLFDFYLDKYDVIQKNIIVIADNATGSSSRLRSDAGDFYYLEYAGNDAQFAGSYPIWDQLSAQYRIVCSSVLPRVRVTKFAPKAQQNVMPPSECVDVLRSKESSL